MGQGFEVETQDLALLGQLFTRQQQHMTAIQGYVRDQCSASGAFTGVMSLLQGSYSPAHETAVTGFGQGSDIAGACQTKITGTRQDLIDTDRRQYEAMRKLNPDLPPYQAPSGGGILPKATSDVPSAGDDQNAVTKFITETGEVIKRPFDAAAAVAGHDPRDPWGHGPSEPMSPDDATSHSYWIQRGMDAAYQRTVDAWNNHRAGGLPGGQDGSYAPGMSDLAYQNRYLDAQARGSQFMTDHTGIAPHTPPGMPGTAYPSDSLRTGVQGFADNAGKVVNIIQAPVNLADSAQRLGDSVDLHNQIETAANGPANTGDRDWADSGGNSW